MAHLFRFFVNPEYIKDNKAIITNKELVFRISRVLRLQLRERIAILDNKGNEYICTIDSINNAQVSLNILKKESHKEKIELNVYASLIKKPRFELTVEKLTEIGVSKITPVISKNCKINSINIERLRKIAKESAEQSGKYFIPEIGEVRNLNDIIKEVKNDFNVVLYKNAKDKISSIKKSDKINLFIGPESDFTDEEIETFIENKFKLVTLGDQLFRTETAAIIGAYLINSKCVVRAKIKI